MLGYVAKGIKVTDVIKIANELTLSYLDEPNVIISILISGERDKRENWKDVSMRRTQLNDTGSGNGRMGHEPRNVGSL